ncbi:hypothetical protein ZWY2020_048393 [Hordeum vulgare]|nr:hypothetical protein ZWY2020_048393 [Hordeum vulgare]
MSFTLRKAPCPSNITVASNVVSPDGIIHYPYIPAVDGRGVFLLCGYTAIGSPTTSSPARRRRASLARGLSSKVNTWSSRPVSKTGPKCRCSSITARRPYRGDGVLSHQGIVWWFDLSYRIGILTCDPFAQVPKFYQIMFPSVPDALPFASNRDIHRCLKVSTAGCATFRSMVHVRSRRSASGR